MSDKKEKILIAGRRMSLDIDADWSDASFIVKKDEQLAQNLVRCYNKCRIEYNRLGSILIAPYSIEIREEA